MLNFSCVALAIMSPSLKYSRNFLLDWDPKSNVPHHVHESAETLLLVWGIIVGVIPLPTIDATL